jgi:hypothetical protein
MDIGPSNSGGAAPEFLDSERLGLLHRLENALALSSRLPISEVQVDNELCSFLWLADTTKLREIVDNAENDHRSIAALESLPRKSSILKTCKLPP